MIPDKKSRPRFLYSSVRLGEDHFVYRHHILSEEPARFVVEANSYHGEEGDDQEPSPLVYADRADLESRGFTPSRGSDGRETLGPILCRDEAATRKAEEWREAELRKFQPPPPSRFDDDSAPHDVKVAYYAEVAKDIQGQFSQAHRGTWDLEDGTVVIFGNDRSPTDHRSEHQVEMLRRRMTEAHLAEELAFAVSQDGESWAMLVRQSADASPDEAFADLLETMLWEAWFDAGQIASL